MFSLSSSHHYFLYQGRCDMRKGFDGLCGLVSTELGRNPTSGEVFVFLNRPRSHIKLLHWENRGFVLYYKRLEKGTFSVPKAMDGRVSMSWAELVLMVEAAAARASRYKRAYRRRDSIFRCKKGTFY